MQLNAKKAEGRKQQITSEINKNIKKQFKRIIKLKTAFMGNKQLTSSWEEIRHKMIKI